MITVGVVLIFVAEGRSSSKLHNRSVIMKMMRNKLLCASCDNKFHFVLVLGSEWL